MMGRFCRHCGVSLAQGTAFCAQCGRDQRPSGPGTPAERRRSDTPLWIGGAIGLLLLASAAAFLTGTMGLPWGGDRDEDIDADNTLEASKLGLPGTAAVNAETGIGESSPKNENNYEGRKGIVAGAGNGGAIDRPTGECKKIASPPYVIFYRNSLNRKSVKNVLSISPSGVLLWNSQEIDTSKLEQYLTITATMNPIPILELDYEEFRYKGAWNKIEALIYSSDFCK